MTQYVYDGDYYTVPTAALSILENRLSPLDSFIMFCTSRNEYSALVSPFVGDDYKLIIRRSSSNGNWEVSQSKTTESYTYTNEYYLYSNIGIGQRLDIDYSALTAVVLSVACTLLFFSQFIRRVPR